MTDLHPITPSPNLRKLWAQQAQRLTPHDINGWLDYVATQAAQWGANQQLKLDAEQIAQAYQKGADQELEACCVEVAWLESSEVAKRMRERRRPEPPSLKELALTALREAESTGCLYVNGRSDLIRRALEALPND
jgi:hypothetical protein